MSHNLNKKDFIGLVGYQSELKSWEDVDPNDVYSERYNLCQFELDYENILLDFIEAQGCVIHKTNHNTWSDMFWVYHTKPTKQVDPSEFFDNWKPKFRWKPRHSFHAITALCCMFIVFLLTLSFT